LFSIESLSLTTEGKELLEILLNREEGPALDFKRDQYPFAKASEEEKSEIVKDILGFCNSPMRSVSYIVIGG
jgi:hypothetical protein